MERTDVVVIGAGQAGLAMSRCLSMRGIDHLVLERGRVAERWRSERWDSLRLLTPRWQTRLPGLRYVGADPGGFMQVPELVALLDGYARSFGAPVHDGTTVLAVRPFGVGYRVITDRGDFCARAVVIATGFCDRPAVPALARRLEPELVQLAPSAYRRPSALPEGGVLVVGASATGVQLAEELQRSGRPVTLAVGRHARVPRRYRGRDVMWWLDRTGALAEQREEGPRLEAARRAPSFQLAGRPSSIDLSTLQAEGVRLCGRLVGAEGGTVYFADDLAQHVHDAEHKLARVLARMDAHAAASGLDAHVDPPDPPAPVRVPPAPARIDLAREQIRSVVWATGFARSYAWLQVEHARDAQGELQHVGGVMAPPGLYALGLPFMRRRNSSFVDGVGRDALELTDHLAAFLSGTHRRVA